MVDTLGLLAVEMPSDLPSVKIGRLEPERDWEVTSSTRRRR